MIVLTRRQAKELRAMIRATLFDQEPKSQWPMLLIQYNAHGLTIHAQKGGTALQYHHPQSKASGELAFSSSVLAELEGNKTVPVELESTGESQAVASWQEGPIPRSVSFATVSPESVAPFPVMPKKLQAVEPALLTALREAMLTTSMKGGRTRLNRILLRGTQGEVIATDGRQLLLHQGFRFPWTGDLLLPCCKLFTRKSDWAKEEIQLGKSDSQLFLKSGSWAFAFLIDTSSRYPDVSTVLPDQASPKTQVEIHPDDAAFLMQAIPKLPPAETEPSPITLDVRAHPTLRIRSSSREGLEIELSKSSMQGSPIQVCLHRANFIRLLQLGFREIYLNNPDQALWCQDHNRLFLFMPIEKSQVIPSSTGLNCISTSGHIAPKKQPSEERRVTPMTSRNGSPTNPDKSEPTLDDLIIEAESLRRMHQEVGIRWSRLITALKAQRKQSRVLRQAVASIKDLNLGS